jgi:hypothetical protein
LLGASDASLKDAKCSHAWILSMGEVHHMEDPNMSLGGYGPVDGLPSDLSLARGELHGQTAYCKHNKLNHHRNANVDLYLEYEKAANQLHRTVTWVQSYQDHDTPWENLT